MSASQLPITIDFDLGTSGCTVDISDLSHKHLDFNSSEYSAAVHAKQQRGLT